MLFHWGTLSKICKQFCNIFLMFCVQNIIIRKKYVKCTLNNKYNLLNETKKINNKISTTVIYGGSVNQTNYNDYLNNPNINGLLLGRASLEPDTFYKIIFNSQ